MEISPERVNLAQSVYSKRILAIYDLFVLGFSNRFVWQCPSREILEFYNRHISDNHLDVGVGTGFFLDRCRFPGNSPRIALMDLNANCLSTTKERIQRYQPEIYQADILQKISLEIPQKFDSIAVNYVFHCLPGSISSKVAIVFDNLKPLLNPGGVIFGSTLLVGGVERNWLAKRIMQLYNDKGVFNNFSDDLAGLERVLSEHCMQNSLQILGCAALFSAKFTAGND